MTNDTLLWMVLVAVGGFLLGLLISTLLRQKDRVSAKNKHSAFDQTTQNNRYPTLTSEPLNGPPVAMLTAQHGEDNGRIWLLRQDGVVTIGRLDDCDIVVAQSEVSRLHAQVNHRTGVAHTSEFTIFDYSSAHSTLVNDSPIQTAATLHDGDVIGIGAQRFRFNRVRR